VLYPCKKGSDSLEEIDEWNGTKKSENTLNSTGIFTIISLLQLKLNKSFNSFLQGHCINEQ